MPSDDLPRDAGILGWELNHVWEGYLIDVAFPVQRVAIDVEGWAWTWHDLTTWPDAVIRDIRTALKNR